MRDIRADMVRAGRVVRNAAIDLRYRGLLIGKTATAYEHLGSRHVENSDYRALDEIFAGRIRDDDVMVDVGCGKGRVINWWLHNGFGDNRIHGLELDPVIAERTRRRLARYDNVSIHAGDALEQLPADATLIYMYNPFVESVMRRFVDRATEMYEPGRLRVLYYNCKHIGVFEEHPNWTVEPVALDSNDRAPFDPAAVARLVDRDLAGS